MNHNWQQKDDGLELQIIPTKRTSTWYSSVNSPAHVKTPNRYSCLPAAYYLSACLSVLWPDQSEYYKPPPPNAERKYNNSTISTQTKQQLAVTTSQMQKESLTNARCWRVNTFRTYYTRISRAPATTTTV